MGQERIVGRHFSKDTGDLLRLMARHGVAFMIVGGEAVIFHGYPRLTGDIDLFYERSRDNAERLYQALCDFWNGSVPGISSCDAFVEDGAIVQFGVPPNRVDLINRIDGVTFREAWKSSIRVTAISGKEAFEVNYIGMESLLRNKLASGRPKDLADAEYLSAIREEGKRKAARRRNRP